MESPLLAIKQGAASWNCWLKYHPDLTPDLEATDLSGMDLRRFNLRSARLQNCHLTGADLRGADLSQADLRGANLQCADLRAACLSHANLQKAVLDAADLRNAHLLEANLQHADLRGARLQNASLRGARLLQANLESARLDKADLRRADLRLANLQDTRLMQIQAQEAVLTAARLGSANAYGANLRGVNSAEKPDAAITRANRIAEKPKDAADIATVASHPIVRSHPETGRKALYCSSAHTLSIDGMTPEESRPLLEYLYRVQQREEFTCRFHWQKGSVAFWDNRAAQHYALNDYHGHRRIMHRVTLKGEVPV